MKLVGVTGTKGSGKNAVSGFISEWGELHHLVVVERGFADKLKLAMARLWWPNITMADAIVWANKFKNDSQAAAELVLDPELPIAYNKGGHGRKIVESVTGRQLFQNGGTHMGREIFGSDFWVDQLLPLARAPINTWEDNFWTSDRRGDPANIAVISDLRFDNEASRIIELEGNIWKVDRPKYGSDGHVSEAGVNSDFITVTIQNDGTLAQLRERVFRACDLVIGV